MERLMKWAVELSEHDIHFLGRSAIKTQAPGNFLVELYQPFEQVGTISVYPGESKEWQLEVGWACQ